MGERPLISGLDPSQLSQARRGSVATAGSLPAGGWLSDSGPASGRVQRRARRGGVATTESLLMGEWLWLSAWWVASLSEALRPETFGEVETKTA